LIIHLCSLIISDSVAVEIFAIGQPCAKIFSKVWCATFLRHGVHTYIHAYIHTYVWHGLSMCIHTVLC